MTRWLLDTNVLSEFRRAKPNRNVLAFLAAQDLAALHISTVTLAEIRYGIALETDVARRGNLTSWLDDDIRRMFRGRILSIDEDVMLRWRMLIGKGRRDNHTFAHPDSIIAATALHHGMTVVSRDKWGFAATGVLMFNPWKAEG